MRSEIEASRNRGLRAAQTRDRSKDDVGALTAHHAPVARHTPFSAKDRQTVLDCATHGARNLDRAFRLAAKLTGRYMYECRAEYMHAVGVSWTGHAHSRRLASRSDSRDDG